MVKNLRVMQETHIWSLGWEDSLEKGMVTHSSILDWRIPWTEEPCGLQSIGSQRVRYMWVTNTSLHITSYKQKVYVAWYPPTIYHPISIVLNANYSRNFSKNYYFLYSIYLLPFTFFFKLKNRRYRAQWFSYNHLHSHIYSYFCFFFLRFFSL